MDEWHFEQAQRREEDERRAGIEAARRMVRHRYTPVTVDGVDHCHDCLEPLPDHRIPAGICVPCLTIREKKGRT